MSDLLNPPFIIAILLALTIHECAHAFVAYRLGDPTAKEEGRLTLNPVAHLDPMGTILFFLIHFGWGKPVPVDPRNFRHPRRDSALVALAGPASNLILAFIVFFLLTLLDPHLAGVSGTGDLLSSPDFSDRLLGFLAEILRDALFLNLALMAFNLLPIAPLDGSKILEPFIPLKYDEAYHRFMQRGPMILIGLLIAENILHIPILLTWISAIMDAVLRVMMVFA